MKSINQEIADILNQDIALQKCLKRSIINIRALAHYVLKEYNLTYTLDAVISAIRRYDVDNVSILNLKSANRVFSEMLISTKDNVAMILLRDGQFNIISKDFLQDKKLRDNVRLIKGKETVSLFVNQKDLDSKIALFPSSSVLDVQQGLSEIRLRFQKDIRGIKGVIARVTSELALLDINIEQVLYTFPDVLLYVKENDLVQAHKSLLALKR